MTQFRVTKAAALLGVSDDTVRRWIDAGNAYAVLGNHEINLLREDAKDGSGWFFDSRVDADQPKYAPFARIIQETNLQCNVIAMFASASRHKTLGIATGM